MTSPCPHNSGAYYPQWSPIPERGKNNILIESRYKKKMNTDCVRDWETKSILIKYALGNNKIHQSTIFLLCLCCTYCTFL